MSPQPLHQKAVRSMLTHSAAEFPETESDPNRGLVSGVSGIIVSGNWGGANKKNPQAGNSVFLC